jgi:outer membrane immunogenic protein
MPKPVTRALASLALLAPATPLCAQTSPWNGVYAGVQGGVAAVKPDASGTNIYQTVDGGAGAAHSDAIDEHLSQSGFAGGARIGFNRQLGHVVIGAEADASLFDLTAAAAVTRPAASYRLQSHASNLETVRARAGLAFGRTLLFATGGVAFSNVRHSLAATDRSQVVVDGGEGSTGVAIVTNDLAATAPRHAGWTVGGGGEMRLTRNLSLALTLLHVDLGSARLANTEGLASIAVTANTRLFVGALGINLHF